MDGSLELSRKMYFPYLLLNRRVRASERAIDTLDQKRNGVGVGGEGGRKERRKEGRGYVRQSGERTTERRGRAAGRHTLPPAKLASKSKPKLVETKDSSRLPSYPCRIEIANGENACEEGREDSHGEYLSVATEEQNWIGQKWDTQNGTGLANHALV